MFAYMNIACTDYICVFTITSTTTTTITTTITITMYTCPYLSSSFQNWRQARWDVIYGVVTAPAKMDGDAN